MNNRILAVLAAIAMLFAFAVNTSAEKPELPQTGSLTLTMEADGKPLDSGRLNLYRVAELRRVEENQYDFQLLDALTAIGATLDTEALYSDVQAQALLTKAQAALEQYQALPIENGKVCFSELPSGLYLVWQGEQDASDGYNAIAPFLISVPKWQGGSYAMQVEAKPKVPFITEPPDTPPPPPDTPPPPPNLPQTGQLNWPVPVMAIGGIALLILGLILCTGKRRCGREK